MTQEDRLMRHLIIHPTHRKLLRLLRDRNNEGQPVVLLKDEFDSMFKALPSIQSPTLRNQLVYRTILRAINRPISDIQQCRGLIVVDKHLLNTIEKVYARVERDHLCYTLHSTVQLYWVRRIKG